MTYINKKQVAYYDSASLDAFSRVRVSGGSGNRFDAEFTFDTLEEIIDEVTGGSGNAMHDSLSRAVLLENGGTATGDFAGLHSYPIPYTAGQSHLVELTGVLNYAALAGGTAQIFIRSSVTGIASETAYPQADWAVDGINTSALQSDVNWAYSQIFVMDFQSLKIGRVRFYLDRGGELVQVHEIKNDNIRNTGYWQTPSQSVYWKIYNDATYSYMEIGYGDAANGIGFRYRVAKNATASMTAVCGTVKSEGGKDLAEMQGYPQIADMGVTTKSVGAVSIPLISIRQRSTFKSIDNNSIAIPQAISVQITNPIRLVLVHDATLTGASWANVDTTHSTIEKDITASAFSGGHILDTEYVATSKNVEGAASRLLGKAVLWYRKNSLSGILTVGAVRTTASSSDTLVSLKWIEIR